jgi:hypothetical protein
MADYFTQLTHLPMLTGPAVLNDCFARGVERGLFAYALGDGEARQFDTIYFRRSIEPSKCEITESAWLLRPDLAKSLQPEQEAVTPDPGKKDTDEGEGDAEIKPGDGSTKDGGVKIIQGERRLYRVRLTMRVPWEHWNEVYNEVIDPLAKEGADIFCDVNILAQSEGGIKENTVELVIRESLEQRGIKANIEKG